MKAHSNSKRINCQRGIEEYIWRSERRSSSSITTPEIWNIHIRIHTLSVFINSCAFMSYFIKRNEKEETLLSGSPFKLRCEYWHGNDAFSLISLSCICIIIFYILNCWLAGWLVLHGESKDNADTLKLAGFQDITG